MSEAANPELSPSSPERRAAFMGMAYRQYIQKAWEAHWSTRFVSLALLPIVAYITVGGWWWVWCLLCNVLGNGFELLTLRRFYRDLGRIDSVSIEKMQVMTANAVLIVTITTSLYSLGFLVLAFSPGVGPVIGTLFCFGGLLVVGAQHVLTRHMVLYSTAPVAIALILNLLALADGLNGWVLAGIGVALLINHFILTRASFAASEELVDAKVEAQNWARELEQRVELRTSEANHARQRAEDASIAKSRFLANMSHELRTPLNAIIGYAEIVQEDLDAKDSDQSVEDISRIKRSAHHLLGLINEVLDLSRIEAGRLTLAVSTVKVQEMVAEVVQTVLPTATRNGATCTFEVVPGDAEITTDRSRLRQCLLNLLSNAAKFTRNGAIHVTASVAGGRARFTVADTGIGIAREDLSRLFVPFSQLDQSDTRQYEGTGLGLVITRQIALALGGDVTVESEPGRGSAFTLTIADGAQATAGERAAA